jgi:hypothetical protein
MAVFIGGNVAEMKMVFISVGRVDLSVSQTKISTLRPALWLRPVRTADSQPDGERQVEK